MGIPLLSESGVLTASSASVLLSSCPRLEEEDSPSVSVVFLALFAVFLALDWLVTAVALWSAIVSSPPTQTQPTGTASGSTPAVQGVRLSLKI